MPFLFDCEVGLHQRAPRCIPRRRRRASGPTGGACAARGCSAATAQKVCAHQRCPAPRRQHAQGPFLSRELVGKPILTPWLLPIPVGLLVFTRSGQARKLVEANEQLLGVNGDRSIHRDFALSTSARCGQPRAVITWLVRKHRLGPRVQFKCRSSETRPFRACAGTSHWFQR